MSAPRDLTATILRVLQRTADVQGNVTMLRAAENIAAELEARHVNDATVGRLAEIKGNAHHDAATFLIASDAALVRVGQAEALREAARRFVGDMADAWGGDSQWLTTGTRVAEVVACVLREWAADLEGECSHEWLDRPESDTRECLVCGTERV